MKIRCSIYSKMLNKNRTQGWLCQKTEEQMKAEDREVVSLLRKGYSIRDVAKLCGKGISTVQRVKSRLNL